MLFKFFFTIILWFNLALATGNDAELNKKPKNRVVFNAINVVANETRKLDAILQQWDGTVQGAFPINSQTSAILSAIKQGIKEAEESKKLRILGALKVKRATKHLIKDTKNVTMDLVYMKDRFKAISLGATVKGNLKKIQDASNEFNKVVVMKLPRIGRPIGRHLGRRVDKIFKKAIADNSNVDVEPDSNGKGALQKQDN
ncbi:hypothetical protein N0V93_009507 [Gnomoniopsis smithogilvyi]|uniref:Uncharacterized protein n=1 Tax=Gnomoniopsis smithogilvyi TaxID=1191159 RepID=A0A9W9CTV4_9PEZI|nr:hypothetical protein N0V93_009507 [Gnomoniopsis smithogilvyi]